MKNNTRVIEKRLTSAINSLQNVNTDEEVRLIRSDLRKVREDLFYHDAGAVNDNKIRRYWPVIKRYGHLQDVRKRGRPVGIGMTGGSGQGKMSEVEIEFSIVALCRESELERLLSDEPK